MFDKLFCRMPALVAGKRRLPRLIIDKATINESMRNSYLLHFYKYWFIV